MITYLYGTDKYRIREYLREHAPNAVVGEEALKTRGLFDQAPVVLYDPPDDLETPEDLAVFVVTDKKPKGKKTSLEFNPLKGPEIAKWIGEVIKKDGFIISSEALEMLAERYRDSWQTKIETDKLLNYAQQKKKIEKSDLEAVSNWISQENIFKLTDAIANQNKRDSVLLLARQLASGADPYYLFLMIVYQFRNMIAPNRSGVHPYAAQKAKSAAARFGANRLKALYQRLAATEQDVKNGLGTMEESLYNFIFSI